MTTEQRLERLERQNGRLKRGMIGMAVAGLSLLVMGQTLPPKVHDVVRAKRFKVVSDGGRTMLTLGSSRISGYKDAIKARSLLEQRLTSKEISEAQRLTREWKPKKNK